VEFPESVGTFLYKLCMKYFNKVNGLKYFC